MKKINFLLVILTLAAVASRPSGLKAQTAPVAPTCDFTRDLQVGDSGSDVFCLQKFLNSIGFTIASSGIGSPGAETDLFGGLTREALAKWQMTQGITPASGYFGPKSRAAYNSPHSPSNSSTANSLTADTVIPSAPGLTTAQDVVNKLNEYNETIKKLQSEKQSWENNNNQENQSRKLLKKAKGLIEEADDRVDEDDSGDDLSEQKSDLNEAEEEFYDALLAFIDENYPRVQIHAEETIELTEDIIKELGGDEEDADDALDDADKAIDDAKDRINEADDDGDDVDEAENLLDDAKDKLDEAEEAFDDEDFDDAVELAEEAEDLADQAVDAIGD